jgi:hypothetical protein
MMTAKARSVVAAALRATGGPRHRVRLRSRLELAVQMQNLPGGGGARWLALHAQQAGRSPLERHDPAGAGPRPDRCQESVRYGIHIERADVRVHQ